MPKKTFASSLLAVVLLFAFVQHQTAANAGIFDWSTLVADQLSADNSAVDSNTDGTSKDSADASTEKKGNGFVRALGAPFRAIGRLFGGGKKNDQTNEDVAYEVMKQKLMELISNEDKANPLSDEELVSRLNEAGYPVARRTVTKYRKMLKIPSSRQRKDWSLAN